MSIAFALFFFPPETLRSIFLPKKKMYSRPRNIVPKNKTFLIGILSVYFIFQIGLPLRHCFFKDDVLWTEEGHRLSWRMMLRSKSGSLTVWVKDKTTGEKERYNYSQLLGSKQQAAVTTKPDLMWQLAQKIKKVEAEKGRNISVFMDSRVRVNDGKYHQFTNPEIDLAA